MVEGILVGLTVATAIVSLIFLRRNELRALRVQNTQAHHMGASEYIMISMSLDGEDVVILLTQHEFDKARERALANPEDVWRHR